MRFAYIPEAAQTASSAACSGNEHLGNTGFPRGKIFFKGKESPWRTLPLSSLLFHTDVVQA